MKKFLSFIFMPLLALSAILMMCGFTASIVFHYGHLGYYMTVAGAFCAVASIGIAANE